MVKTLVIAGTHSGVGKTTLVVGLIAALRARGLSVQSFKVGPDYIDAGHHSLAAGRPCRNLDSWMMSSEQMQSLFEYAAQGADVAIIEGVMGLFDGLGYEEETGSTAQVAKLLHAPVLLTVDASKMARSAAALAKGFQCFDPEVLLAGYLINRAGSAGHGRGVASAISKATALPVLGWLARNDKLHVPERHLGLIPSAEPGPWAAFADAAGKAVEESISLDKLLDLIGDYPLPSQTTIASRPLRTKKATIAVARDEAFHFCYEENLILLEQAGAALKFFSPMHDAGLPDGTTGILLSGGFPELYGPALAANVSMHESLRTAFARGLPIYAECGGLMYLTEAIVDFEGKVFPMVGLLPGKSVMTRQLALGYRRARARAASWLVRENETVRGHEFHYSQWQGRPDSLPPAYDLVAASGHGEPRCEGACLNNLLASYMHVHFWGKPELAERFVEACCH